VKVTIYLTNMDHKAKVAEVRRSYFTKPPPATTLVSVKSLADPNLLIEIDAIAFSK
jgi:2-iminobutanoate/2-iminopropanoate deaminase